MHYFPNQLPQLIFLILLMVQFIIILQDIPTINLLKLALISPFLWTVYRKQSPRTTYFLHTMYFKTISSFVFSQRIHHLKLGTSFISRPPLRDPNQCPHGWMIANIPMIDVWNTGCNSLLWLWLGKHLWILGFMFLLSMFYSFPPSLFACTVPSTWNAHTLFI